MDINDLSYRIIGCVYNVYNVYNKLGPGLLESVYEKALMREFQKADIKAVNQQKIDVKYDGEPLGLDLRLDIVVEDTIILELKSVEKIMPVHLKQLLTYLKLADKRLGLLVNFNVNNIAKEGIHRIVNKL